MHAPFGYPEKIYFWLIIVFFYSGLPIQKEIPNNHLEGQVRQRISTKANLPSKPLQLNPINSSIVKVLAPRQWDPKLLYQGLKANPNPQQHPSRADHLAYSPKNRTCSEPMSPHLKFHSTIEETNRSEHQSSVASKQTFKQEIRGTTQLPRPIIIRGNGFMAFLLAGSIGYLYKLIKSGAKPIKNQITKAHKLSLLGFSKNKKSPPPLVKTTQDKEQTVPREVVCELWQRLDRFEKDKGYLDKELNLTKLARRLKTNQRYLSHVINKYKKMSFTTYMKTLRITNAKNRLLKEPKLQRYNQEGLADEFGFKSGRTLSLAFSKLTGKPLSKILEELGD